MAILKERVGLSNVDMLKLRSMRPGMPLDLQVVSPNATKRVRTEFVGMDGTRCLIMKFPDESKWGSLRDAIYPDNHMVVRYILEDETGEIIAFKVKVTLVLSKPGNYVFTTFPLSIQSHGLRTEPRAQTQIPVKMVDAENRAVAVDGRIVDLSSSGCRVSVEREGMKDKIATKQNVLLLIKRNDGSVQNLKGTVMNTRSDQVRLYYGIKFDEDESLVEALMQQLMIK